MPLRNNTYIRRVSASSIFPRLPYRDSDIPIGSTSRKRERSTDHTALVTLDQLTQSYLRDRKRKAERERVQEGNNMSSHHLFCVCWCRCRNPVLMPQFCQPCAYGYHHDDEGMQLQLRAFHEVAQMQQALEQAATAENGGMDAKGETECP